MPTPYLLLSLTILSWAGNAIVGKLAAGEVSPLLLTALRWGVASAIVLPFAWRHMVADRETIRLYWPRLAALGFVGFSLFNAMLYVALERTTAMNVVLVQGGMPAVIFLFSFLVFRRSVAPLQIAGFVLTLLGVVVVVMGTDEELGAIGTGDVVILLAMLVYAAYTVALAFKPAMHWLSAVCVMGLFGFLFSLPLAGWEIATGRANWPRGWEGAVIVAYTGVFPSLVAQMGYIRANEMIGANRAGMFVNFTPVVGALLAVLILEETFHWTHGVALALTIGGIVLAEWVAGRKERSGSGDPVPGARPGTTASNGHVREARGKAGRSYVTPAE